MASWSRLSSGLGGRVVLQASFFASLGLGALALRRLTATALHPVLCAEYPELVERHANLAATLTQVAPAVDEVTFRAVLDLMRSIAAAEAAAGPRAQWDITRDSAKLLALVRAATSRTTAQTTEAAFRSSLLVQEDVLPQLQGQLDDLLHNHLLSRGG